MPRHPFPLVRGIVSVLLVAAAIPAQGQVPLSPRSLGVAGAWVGGARGQEALFVNPANLGLPGTPRWSVAVPQISIRGTVAGPNLGDVPDLFRYNNLPDARRDEIFAAFPQAGAEVRLDVRAPLVSFQRGRLAFGIAYGSVGDHTFSRDLVELALYGYEQGRLDYGVAGTAGSSMSFWDFAIAYGDRVGPLSWGVTAHYLRGGTLLRSWLTEPRYDLAATDIDLEYVGVLTRGGHGFALDVGTAYQPHPTVTLSAALSNVASGMRWSDELRIRSLRLDSRSLDDDPVDLFERYGQSERPVTQADAAATRGVTARTLRDGAYLPTTARLGAAWQPLARTHLGASYYGAITGGRLSGSWDRMLSLGVQQRIPVLTLRAGYATNLDDGSLLSGGISLGPIEIGVARLDDGQYDSATRSGWIGAVGLSIQTRSTMP
jgi:hypothetical protein